MMPRHHPDHAEHPIFDRQRLHIDTPALNTLRDTLHRWLWTGATGGLIIGSARVGKTTAVRTLCTQLRTRANRPFPAYYASTPKRDQHTITSVFRALCFSAELRVTNADRADVLSDRYVHYIADQAAQTGCPYALLFVDEMQRLDLAQFGPFAELYDRLSELGIALTVVFVANDQESVGLLKHIGKPEYSHIRGRFFTQRTEFLGLTSKQELQSCLAQYDTLRYPADGPTYTAFFLPEAAAQGWRLASLADPIWRVFHEHYQVPYHIGSWGMQYFVTTINTLLTDFLPRTGVDAFDDAMVHECIGISGLLPSLVQVAP